MVTPIAEIKLLSAGKAGTDPFDVSSRRMQHEGAYMTLYRHFPIIAATALILAGMLMHTQAASLREVIRTCGDDGKLHCEGVGYGKPMQSCLSSNKDKLVPACKTLVERLDAGENVTLF